MITREQLKKGRIRAGLTVGQLAERTMLPPAIILQSEMLDGEATITAKQMQKLKRALEAEGVVFVAGNGAAPSVSIAEDHDK